MQSLREAMKKNTEWKGEEEVFGLEHSNRQHSSAQYRTAEKRALAMCLLKTERPTDAKEKCNNENEK